MFSVGFTKIANNAASGGTNNQGLEFKSSDTNNATANVGPGGMTPAGIESYQSVPKEPQGASTGKKKKGMTTQQIAQFFTSKMAGVQSGVAKLESGGSTAAAVTGALKQDVTSDDMTQEEVNSKIQAERKRMKRYARAESK